MCVTKTFTPTKPCRHPELLYVLQTALSQRNRIRKVKSKHQYWLIYYYTAVPNKGIIPSKTNTGWHCRSSVELVIKLILSKEFVWKQSGVFGGCPIDRVIKPLEESRVVKGKNKQKESADKLKPSENSPALAGRQRLATCFSRSLVSLWFHCLFYLKEMPRNCNTME